MSATTTEDDFIHVELPDDDTRGVLEAEAEDAKGRLLDTLERLDRKRHHMTDTVAHVRRDLLVPAIVGGVVVGLLFMELRYRTWKSKKAVPTSAIERWSAMRRAWMHPDRVAPDAPAKVGGGMLEQIGVKLVSALASMLVTHLAKTAIPQAIVAPITARDVHHRGA